MLNFGHKIMLAGLVSLALTAAQASAGLMTYTGETSFDTAIGGATLAVAGFESLTLGLDTGPYVEGDLSMNTTSGYTFGNTSANVVTEGLRAENWQQNADGDITFTFANAINAFAIDIKDFAWTGNANPEPNTLLVSVDGATPFSMFVDHAGSEGNYLFLGLFDDTSTFTTVTFSDTAVNGDGIGFDRLQSGLVSSAPPVVPEPGTIALLAVAAAGLAIARRRRNR
jgi:hypothetical protein